LGPPAGRPVLSAARSVPQRPLAALLTGLYTPY
jgi:hypothetical protein